MHILTAEDDMVSRLVLEAYLNKSNHTFVSTCNGVELLDAFRKSPNAFDAVMTDVMMPVMTGLEAAREIKKINNVRIIVLTAFDNKSIIKDAEGKTLCWGCCDYYLSKPLKIACMLETLINVEYDNYTLKINR
jgi:CheY-like chemotaxis protein